MLNNYYQIENILPVDENQLLKGSYIILSPASAIPPHLALMIDGNIYSITIKGPKLDFPLQVQMAYFKKFNIEALFVRLKDDLIIHNNQLFIKARNHTLNFRKVEMGVTTCLSPIKSFCEDVFDLTLTDVSYIYELIPALLNKNLIEGFYHFGMELFIRNNCFSIRKYSLSDIYENIYQLESTLS